MIAFGSADEPTLPGTGTSSMRYRHLESDDDELSVATLHAFHTMSPSLPPGHVSGPTKRDERFP